VISIPGMASDWQRSKRDAEVLGRRMAFVERGEGDPLVFLHGNPTSSFLWRSVMEPLEGHGRLIAPDLIGMSAATPSPAIASSSTPCWRSWVSMRG
jgi:pimeloyl-ACP methyl ester carboxylesterase